MENKFSITRSAIIQIAEKIQDRFLFSDQKTPEQLRYEKALVFLGAKAACIELIKQGYIELNQESEND